MMPAYMWVNALSWKDIGNKDESQRKEFVREVAKIQCEVMIKASQIVNDLANSVVGDSLADSEKRMVLGHAAMVLLEKAQKMAPPSKSDRKLIPC